MAYSTDQVAHRWAHNMMGRNGEVYGNSVHANSISFYSYSTVIAQYVDREKGVVLYDDRSYSNTTCKHQNAVSMALPNSVVVIVTDNANVLWWREKWDANARMKVVDDLIGSMYEGLKPYLTSKNHGFDPYYGNNTYCRYRNLPAINKLNELYGDCSLKKWLRSKRGKLGKCGKKSEQYKKRNMVKALIENQRLDKVVDATFGDGTWAAYMKRNSAIDKARVTMAKTNMFMRDYMGFDFEPFGGVNRHHWGGSMQIRSKWSVKQLRKMTVSERIDIRAQVKYNREHGIYGSDIFGEEKRKQDSYNRALKFLGITTYKPYRWGNDAEERLIDSIVDGDNMIYSRTQYDRVIKANGDTGSYIRYPKELQKEFNFAQDSELYKMFCEYPDKFLFRKRLQKKLEIYQRRIKGYWLQECIKENPDLQLSGDENHMLNEIIIRMEHWAAEEAERRRVEAQRRAEEERERRERERQRQLETIKAMEEYKNGGLDAVRDLYWNKDKQLPYEIRYNKDINFGGNVLLRFAHQEGYIETSKGIRLSFEECHRYWNTIKRWHDTGKFEENVTMAGYRVNSFENDILVAGCHEIAYCEMERMYAAMCEKEAA